MYVKYSGSKKIPKFSSALLFILYSLIHCWLIFVRTEEINNDGEGIPRVYANSAYQRIFSQHVTVLAAVAVVHHHDFQRRNVLPGGNKFSQLLFRSRLARTFSRICENFAAEFVRLLPMHTATRMAAFLREKQRNYGPIAAIHVSSVLEKPEPLSRSRRGRRYFFGFLLQVIALEQYSGYLLNEENHEALYFVNRRPHGTGFSDLFMRIWQRYSRAMVTFLYTEEEVKQINRPTRALFCQTIQPLSEDEAILLRGTETMLAVLGAEVLLDKFDELEAAVKQWLKRHSDAAGADAQMIATARLARTFKRDRYCQADSVCVHVLRVLVARNSNK